MQIAFHFLRAKALAIHEKLNAVQIRIAPDLNLLACFAVPIPVRKQMQSKRVSLHMPGFGMACLAYRGPRSQGIRHYEI